MKKLALFSIIFLGFLGLVKPAFALAGAPNMILSTFVVATDKHPDWTTSLSDVGLGETVYFYMDFINNGEGSTAENTTARFLIPYYNSPSLTMKASVWTSTGTAGQGADDKTVNIVLNDANTRLVYRLSSTRVTGDMNGDGTNDFSYYLWPTNDVFWGGINLGSLTANNQHIQILAEGVVSDVLNPNLAVDAKVKNVASGDYLDSINTQAPAEVEYRLVLHNTDVPSTAQNVKIKVNLSQGNLTQSQAQAQLSASNASTATDTTTVNISPAANFAYIPGSTKITWDPDGDGNFQYLNATWPTDELVGEGITLPSSLYGCNNYVVQVYFRARLTANVVPTLTPTSTPTPTPTPTPVPTGTPTPTPTLPAGVTPTITPTPTRGPTPTATPTPAVLPKTATPIEGMLSLLIIGFGASVLGFGLKKLVGGYLKEM